MAGAGDVDADGYDDLLVGARLNSDGGYYAGAAYLLYGPLTTDGDLSIADIKLVGEASGDLAGAYVSSGGDVNADGYDDVLVTACCTDGTGYNAGTVYLLHGPLTADRDLSLSDARLMGEAAQDRAAGVGAGDVDADGYDDILVGASDEFEEEGPGSAYLVYGPVTADLDLSLADIGFQAEASGDHLGFRTSGAGDVDGDGFLDLLAGAYGNDAGGSNAGAAYLILHASLF